MKKKTKKLLIISGIILLLVVSSFFIFQPFTIFTEKTVRWIDDETTKYHYAGYGPLTPSCSVDSLSSPYFREEKIVITNKSTFKFVVKSVEPMMGYNGYFNGIIVFREIKVYRNGFLIDTISGIPNQEIATCGRNFMRDQVFLRAYSDSGKVYIPQGDEITPIYYTENPLLKAGTCAYNNPSVIDMRFTNYNIGKEIKLPTGETGVNAYFGFFKEIDYACCSDRNCGRPSYISKYEIVGEQIKDINYYVEYINSLNLTVQENIEIIQSLKLELNQQIELISKLTTNREEQAQIIKGLESDISKQAEMINSLTSNLEEKARLVSLLYVENEKQAKLIEEMKLSFSDQGIIIEKLGKTIEDDAEIIKNLNLNNEEQVQLISRLNLSLEEEKQLVSKLEDELLERQELIDKIEKEKSEAESKFMITLIFSIIGIVLLVGILIFLFVKMKKRKR